MLNGVHKNNNPAICTLDAGVIDTIVAARDMDMTDSSERWGRGLREKARDQAMAMAMRRKEDYLGARVPRWLKDKVMDRAKHAGVPVSILIRNILEEAFREDRDDRPMRSPASADIKADARPTGAKHFPTVIGWEQIKLNRNMACSGCGRHLSAGARVSLGLVGPGEEHVILCGLCEELL